jgi:hypothetical protein
LVNPTVDVDLLAALFDAFVDLFQCGYYCSFVGQCGELLEVHDDGNWFCSCVGEVEV